MSVTCLVPSERVMTPRVPCTPLPATGFDMPEGSVTGNQIFRQPPWHFTMPPASEESR